MTMPEWNDADLIEACLDGDEHAWRTLLERYNRLIYTIPLRMGFSKVVADEVFQEVCLILLEKLDTLRDRSRLSSWIMTVTRRTCIHRLRKKQPVQGIDIVKVSGPIESTPEDKLLHLEEKRRVQLAFERLSPRCQRLLRALFIEDPPLTYEIIAEELDMALGSIGPTRSRCLEKLRQQLIKLEQEAIEEGQA